MEKLGCLTYSLFKPRFPPTGTTALAAIRIPKSLQKSLTVMLAPHQNPERGGLNRACCGYPQSYTRVWHGCGLNLVRGGARDKKFFVQSTECWAYGCESDMGKKFNATESLWHKGVATFSCNGETTYWSFHFSMIL